MSYGVWKLSEGGAEKAHFSDILSSEKPVQVFLGGLFHLEGLTNGKALQGLLRGLGGPEAEIFYIQEETPTPWQEKIRANIAYEQSGAISPAARALARDILLPDAFKNQAQLQAHFSKISLVGYSAGTNLIRQMESVAAERLAAEGMDVSATLSCLVSTELGPTYHLRPEEKGITRLVVAHRKDKMAAEIARFSYPPARDSCVTAERTDHALLLVPETGTPTVRAVIADAAGTRLSYEEHEEAHALPMYLNVTEKLKNGDKEVSTYAALPTAVLTRAFNARAVEASAESLKTGKPRNGPALSRRFAEETLSPQRLAALAASFAEEERAFKKIAGETPPAFQKSMWDPAAVNVPR